jgi:glucose/mannose transport system permease protein
MTRTLTYLLLIFFALVYLLPLGVMLITSFKTMPEILTGNMLKPPQSLNLEAWGKAWGTACVGLTCEGIKGYFWNSLKMAVPAVLLSTLLGALNGYVLTKWRFKGHKIIFGLMLFACFIPFQVVLLPMASTLGLLNQAGFNSPTLHLILVHTIYGLGFTTLFFRNFYEAFPNELIKAAMMDGAGFFNIFRRVLLPASTPIIVVTIIYQFTNIWNDFLFGASYAAGENMPMTVALNNIVNTTTGNVEYNVNMAAAIIAALPTLLIYIVAGKFFVRGLMAGAVKG